MSDSEKGRWLDQPITKGHMICIMIGYLIGNIFAGAIF